MSQPNNSLISELITPFPVSPREEMIHFNPFPRQLAGKAGKGVNK
jgi:hypothetical protein